VNRPMAVFRLSLASVSISVSFPVNFGFLLKQSWVDSLPQSSTCAIHVSTIFLAGAHRTEWPTVPSRRRLLRDTTLRQLVSDHMII
jgi:hypothetical protein